MSAAVATPQQDLQHEATHWTQLASSFQVVDQSTYETAARHLQAIKALQGEADSSFDPIIRKAFEAHREALAQKKRITDPLTQAEVMLKRTMGGYVQAQERKRIEEERRLREFAERQAAEAREAEIEEAESCGASVEEVTAIAQAPLRTAPVVVPAAAKVSGISSRENWRSEVTNVLALVKFVAANPQFLSLVQANHVAIGGMARSLKSTMNIPGVKVWSETGIAARRA